MLLDDKAGIDVSDRAGMTALHHAVSKNHGEMVSFLIKKGAPVNAPDKKGCTPLFYAVSLDFVDVANTLLRYDADANHQDVKGRSPSHCAAKSGNNQMLTVLLHSNGNLWLPTAKMGHFPIHEAAIAKQNNTVEFILDVTPEQDAVDRVSANNATVLHLAAISNNKSLCRILMRRGANTELQMTLDDGAILTPLQAAILKESVEATDVLQGGDGGADPTDDVDGGGGAKPKKGKGKKDKKKDKKKKKK